MAMLRRIQAAWPLLLVFVLCQHLSLAASSDSGLIPYTGANGQTVYLADDRKPSLYTGNFGDCLGDSVINITRFDAAFYQDNQTVTFHLDGNSALVNASLMMFIGVYAYGSNRFDLIFNPCDANIASLCPLNANVPVEAAGIVPVTPAQVSGIPGLAFSIPDFEGEAILRIFDNATQQEIACYSGVVTNGKSFSHQKSVGTVLGIFTLVALIASFATSIYGESISTIRLHYAHSMSVGVVFAVFHHIFFSGALSVNWPSVLVAWWSNFAWSAGMINLPSMQSSINHLIGNNVGNTSEVGAAPSGSNAATLGGGYDISAIYRRALGIGIHRAANHPLMRNIASETYRRDPSLSLKRDVVQHMAERSLRQRSAAGQSSGFSYYGHPVGSGLPLPGNYSGFAGTLAQEGIRVSNAFMTGLLWFLILLAILIGAVVAFKWILEGLVRMKRIEQGRLRFFRDHWVGYATMIGLRACFIAFFMMMFLTTFQFTYSSSAGVKGIAAVVFFLFLAGISGAAAYAIRYQRKLEARGPRQPDSDDKSRIGSIQKRHDATSQDANPENQPAQPEPPRHRQPFWTRAAAAGTLSDAEGNSRSIHDNADYTTRFGWLASRFRRTRWWFFTVWIFYELARAIFFGAASGHPLIQVFGLLVIETLAFLCFVWARPFEGRRLNILVVYCLGFSKVATVALSAAFDIQFNLSRITTTVIGIAIIIVQGILTIITLVAIILGAISSYMSISRNREEFRPRKWHGLREKYFNHMDLAVGDRPSVKRSPVREEEPKSGFEMKNVRRISKIEDDDPAFAAEIQSAADPHPPVHSELEETTRHVDDGDVHAAPATPGKQGRATSIRSARSTSGTGLPYGARPHRPSWSTRDFAGFEFDASEQPPSPPPVGVNRTLSDEEPPSATPSPSKGKRVSRTHSRSNTISAAPPAQAITYRDSRDDLHANIAAVPEPLVRPRTSTVSSRPASRHSGITLAEASEICDRLAGNEAQEPYYSPSTTSKRGSMTFRKSILAPALELEESPSSQPEETSQRAESVSSKGQPDEEEPSLFKRPEDHEPSSSIRPHEEEPSSSNRPHGEDPPKIQDRGDEEQASSS